jgi:ATP-dependent DNA ligase
MDPPMRVARAQWCTRRSCAGFTRRKRALSRVIWATTTVVSQVFSTEERGRDLFAAAARLDLEGIVAKRKADPYSPETVWYKVKNSAYTQAEGRWELFQRHRG